MPVTPVTPRPTDALRAELKARFLQAIDALSAARVRHPDGKLMRGRNSFATIYGINSGNWYRFQQPDGYDHPDVTYFHYLVRDFGVSAHWLLTGEGEMFTHKNAGRVSAGV